MPAHTRVMDEALASASGMVDVTKIEIEVLPGGTFRWTVWDRARRLVAAPFKLGELDDYMLRTELVLEAMGLEPPDFGDDTDAPIE